MLEYDLGEELGRALQPDTHVLRAVLENRIDEDLLHVLHLELHAFKVFNIVDSVQGLQFLDVLRSVTQLHDDALRIDLHLSNHLLLICSFIF